MSDPHHESTVSPDFKWVTADLRAVARKGSGMSRDTSGTGGQTRSSALWGTGNRGGDSRANALWGKGGRGFAAFMLVLVATAVPLAGAGKGSNRPSSTPSYVDAYLTGMAENHPNTLVNAIIQSTEGAGEAQDAFKHAGRMDKPERVKDSYKFISSVAVTVKAKKIPVIAKRPGLTITHDSTVELSALFRARASSGRLLRASARSGGTKRLRRRTRRRSRSSTPESTRTGATSTWAPG